MNFTCSFLLKRQDTELKQTRNVNTRQKTQKMINTDRTKKQGVNLGAREE
jgi:hypothetical protein